MSHQLHLRPLAEKNALGKLTNQLLAKPEMIRARFYNNLLSGFHGKLTTTTSVNGRRVVVDGKPVINFGSANYLGLDQHPAVLKAASDALYEWGNHSGCSRIFSTHANLVELEKRIASLVGSEAAMVCASTSATHQGVVPVLFGSNGAEIFLDRYAHTSMHQASLIAVAKGAKILKCDVRNLPITENQLCNSKAAVKVLMVDGVYSMQGHCPDLVQLQKICDENNAILYIDDAHGIGIFGERGGGVVESHALSFNNMILTGTLQKGLGAYGGFVAGQRSLIDLLRVTSRSYVFSGTLQPHAVAGALAAIEICESAEGKNLREELAAKSRTLRKDLRDMGFQVEMAESPIISVMIGAELRTLMSGRRLFDEGLYVNSVLHPATPKGEGLLRISLNATHSEEDIAALLNGFHKLKIYLENYSLFSKQNLSYAKELTVRQIGRWVKGGI